jgi:hypothetical protein
VQLNRLAADQHGLQSSKSLILSELRVEPACHKKVETPTTKGVISRITSRVEKQVKIKNRIMQNIKKEKLLEETDDTKPIKK